jgi:hypothetical protein
MKMASNKKPVTSPTRSEVEVSKARANVAVAEVTATQLAIEKRDKAMGKRMVSHLALSLKTGNVFADVKFSIACDVKQYCLDHDAIGDDWSFARLQKVLNEQAGFDIKKLRVEGFAGDTLDHSGLDQWKLLRDDGIRIGFVAFWNIENAIISGDVSIPIGSLKMIDKNMVTMKAEKYTVKSGKGKKEIGTRWVAFIGKGKKKQLVSLPRRNTKVENNPFTMHEGLYAIYKDIMPHLADGNDNPSVTLARVHRETVRELVNAIHPGTGQTRNKQLDTANAKFKKLSDDDKIELMKTKSGPVDREQAYSAALALLETYRSKKMATMIVKIPDSQRVQIVAIAKTSTWLADQFVTPEIEIPLLENDADSDLKSETFDAINNAAN